LEGACLAEFAADYNLKDKTNEPVLREKARIIRYVRYKPSPDDPTDLDHLREKIVLYLPFRNELDTLALDFRTTYDANKPQILENEAKYTTNLEDLTTLEEDLEAKMMASQSKSTKTSTSSKTSLIDLANELPELACTARVQQTYRLHIRENDEYLKLMRCLNLEQQAFVYHVMHLVRNGKTPFHYFLSGGAGVGKSVVVNAVFEWASRHYQANTTVDPTLPCVLKLAPTGIAACNIKGNTLNSALHIPFNKGKKPYPLSGAAKGSFQANFINVKLVIIDEISMVGSDMFNWIDQRL
jgi:DNA replication protein DnaC